MVVVVVVVAAIAVVLVVPIMRYAKFGLVVIVHRNRSCGRPSAIRGSICRGNGIITSAYTLLQVGEG